VLYVPAKTYSISGTLSVDAAHVSASPLQFISIVGADPATTQIVWVGASGGTMMRINGTAYSRYSRLTFNGNNLAAVAVAQIFDGTGVGASFDESNEYADDVFENAQYGCSAAVPQGHPD
jgi:hypothetical protein